MKQIVHIAAILRIILITIITCVVIVANAQHITINIKGTAAECNQVMHNASGNSISGSRILVVL